MKKSIIITVVMAGLLGVATTAAAIPTLQLGSYALTPGQGTYVDYLTSLPDEDTAFITNGYKLLAAGSYANQPELQIGGQYPGGLDWTQSPFDLSSDFAGRGAIIMATVAEGSRNDAGVSVKLNNIEPFLKLDTFNNYPNNHYPVNQERDFFFWDVGNFARIAGATTNFDTEDGSTFDGEIKEFDLAVLGLDTVHFDIMALVTYLQGKTTIKTSWSTEPNSKDVTYNNTPVPEPATMLLLGTGLAGLAGVTRWKKAKK